LGVVVLTQSVARKPFHDKCNIKKPTKNKAFSLNLATFGASPTVGLLSAHRALLGLRRLYAGGAKTGSYKGNQAHWPASSPVPPRSTIGELQTNFSQAADRRAVWGREQVVLSEVARQGQNARDTVHDVGFVEAKRGLQTAIRKGLAIGFPGIDPGLHRALDHRSERAGQIETWPAKIGLAKVDQAAYAVGVKEPIASPGISVHPVPSVVLGCEFEHGSMAIQCDLFGRP
jgi:hypothetical protein